MAWFNWKQAKQTVVQERAVTIADMADLLLTIPEISEAYTRADIELALDDRGWLTPSGRVIAEMDGQTRSTLVNKSRLYWARDPLAKQAVRLWTDYAMGTGITYQSDDSGVQDSLQKFMRDRRNRRVMSSEGQRKSSKKLLVDGELFFAIFSDKDGSKVIRTIDPLQITDIITDPEDSEHILAYRRLVPQKAGTAAKAFFYADWSCDAEDRTLAEEQRVPGIQETVSLESDVVVYHLPFDAIHQRGNGLLFSVVDWTREHRRFMEARVAITQALSKYAYKLSVKGGQGVVDAVKKKLSSTYATGSANQIEKNPQTAPGGTWIQNDGLDLAAVPKATGAGDSEKDGNQLKLMVSAGTGIMLHYFGDPSTGNLATATAMELPMLKMFDSYQELWKDAYRDIFSIVLDDDPDDVSVDPQDQVTVELPPILADDLTALGTALNSIAQLWPEIAQQDEVLTGVLTAMRVPNIEDVLEKMKKDRAKAEADQAKKDAAMAKLMVAGKGKGGISDQNTGGTGLLNAAEATELAQALRQVAESLQG